MKKILSTKSKGAMTRRHALQILVTSDVAVAAAPHLLGQPSNAPATPTAPPPQPLPPVTPA